MVASPSLEGERNTKKPSGAEASDGTSMFYICLTSHALEKKRWGQSRRCKRYSRTHYNNFRRFYKRNLLIFVSLQIHPRPNISNTPSPIFYVHHARPGTPARVGGSEEKYCCESVRGGEQGTLPCGGSSGGTGQRRRARGGEKRGRCGEAEIEVAAESRCCYKSPQSLYFAFFGALT